MQSCFINALSVCLSLLSCLSLPCFACFLKHRRDLEHCILFVLRPLFSSILGTLCRLGLPVREVVNMMQLIDERFVALLQDLWSVRPVRWKMRELDLQIFYVFSAGFQNEATLSCFLHNE